MLSAVEITRNEVMLTPDSVPDTHAPQGGHIDTEIKESTPAYNQPEPEPDFLTPEELRQILNPYESEAIYIQMNELNKPSTIPTPDYPDTSGFHRPSTVPESDYVDITGFLKPSTIPDPFNIKKDWPYKFPTTPNPKPGPDYVDVDKVQKGFCCT